MLSRMQFIVTGLACMTASPSSFAVEEILSERDLAVLGYSRHWESQVELDRGGMVTTVHRRDDNLYVVTDRGEVHAVHAGVGLPRWSRQLAAGVYEVFAPSHFLDGNKRPLVVFATVPRTIIVDRYSGDVIADMPLEEATSSGAVADAENIYFGSSDGHIYSMIWNEPRTKSAVFRWKAMAGGPVRAAPVLVNGGDDLVFASTAGSVFRCTAAFKILHWEFRTRGAITGDIFADDSATFVASTDRSLYRLDTVSGVQRWRARFPEDLHRGPVVAGRTVYQYCLGHGVTALDADSGEVLWNNIDAEQFLSADVDHAFLMTADHRLLMIDASDGQTHASVDLPHSVLPIRNTVDQAIYLASAYGQLLCAMPAGTPQITPEGVLLDRLRLHGAPTQPPEPELQRDEPGHIVDDSAIDLEDPLRSKSKVTPLGGRRNGHR